MTIVVKETFQVRIDKDTSEFVQRLLTEGLFKTKSDVIRHLLHIGIISESESPEIAEKVKTLRTLEKSTGKFPMELKDSLHKVIVNRDRFDLNTSIMP